MSLFQINQKISEAAYHNLIEEINEGFCVIELIYDSDKKVHDYRFIQANPAFEYETGLTNVVGRLGSEVWVRQEPEWLTIFEQIYRTRVPAHFELEAKSLFKVFEIHAFRLGWNKKPLIGMLFNNITIRKELEVNNKKTEEEINKKEKELEALIRATSEVIYRMSPDWEYMYTLSGGFLMPTSKPNKNWLNEYIPKNIQQKVINKIENALEERSKFELEHKVITNTGSEGWTHSTAIPIFNRKGDVVEWLGAARDITDRKTAENALLRSEKKWVTTLESINEAVIATDSNGKITFINSEAECLTGWRKDEAINQLVSAVFKTIDENTRKSTENLIFNVLKEGTGYRLKNHTVLIRKEENEIPISQSIAPVIIKGKKIGLVFIFHDLTENKLMEKKLKDYNFNLEEKVKERTWDLAQAREQAESANKLKTTFLLSMSHELRTPLNSIIGLGGILKQELAGPLNEEQKKQADMILQSGRQLLYLVNDILDMSKIEAGQFTVNRELINLGDMIGQVIETEKPAAENKGLDIQMIRPGKDIMVETDPVRFHQVLSNLVHNAVKFTDEGYIKIAYGMEKDNIWVKVSDTGIGIKEENLNRLFISFSHVEEDNLIRKRGTGTGLGLAISKKIMDLLNGTINVKSIYGEGSEFTVTLPLTS